ncbi:EVE domain-containing protein [Tanticharoenia sakaeratensis]|uniref:EVE domain-containing protein n=1 Tax=Tanticharoenia sakaeratensis NBRC 103193 TaxID=1231623 RepID=A0A0D6MHD6_9PROT|nr:EVE domain-containing protein [Tanticharoenia sakaeratensis]GAN53042.1 hypothetical protein Tasa_004_107 [Tanticharoenia sakaeratensis NBRC 103193]GBQ19694.1 hypothetical protein AA103193_1116 [Tanticharoenia sakaeratensis NBRC 103193]
MQYWLIKSEPESFSWAQQVDHDVEPWTGVRNHLAKRNLEAMRVGDLAFFYHSVSEKAVVGVVRIVREAYPDPTAQDAKGSWVCVDVKACGPMPKPVALADIKASGSLSGMALVRQSRLSVSSVTREEWDKICAMGGYRT